MFFSTECDYPVQRWYPCHLKCKWTWTMNLWFVIQWSEVPKEKPSSNRPLLSIKQSMTNQTNIFLGSDLEIEIYNSFRRITKELLLELLSITMQPFFFPSFFFSTSCRASWGLACKLMRVHLIRLACPLFGITIKHIYSKLIEFLWTGSSWRTGV